MLVIFADRKEFAFLQDAQQLRLEFEIEFADLIEHERTAVGGTEESHALGG